MNIFLTFPDIFPVSFLTGRKKEEQMRREKKRCDMTEMTADK